MDNKLESLAVVVSPFPVYQSRGISPTKGIITITKTGLGLVSKWRILGDRHYSLPYSEIDSYSITPMGVYINHRSKSCPRYVSIRKLPFRSGKKGDQDLSSLTQALEDNGVHSQPIQVRKTTWVLLTVFLFVFLAFAAFVIWSGLYS